MSCAESSDKVVILDRDGTMVIDRGYLGDPAGLEFEPGAGDALRLLHECGFRLVVITNQSGVGRGFFPLDRLISMNAHLAAMVDEAGAKLSGIYFCPHTPDAGCACRKPALGLLNLAAAELKFDPKSAIVVGDKESDIEFGRRAGATTVLLARDVPAPVASVVPDIVAPNLMEAARTIVARYA
jgi:D-glycero-D-manno-heptose 1,7-bisphosphate phosphatase